MMTSEWRFFREDNSISIVIDICIIKSMIESQLSEKRYNICHIIENEEISLKCERQIGTSIKTEYMCERVRRPKHIK